RSEGDLTMMHMAAKSAQPASIIEALVDAGFPIDCRDSFGYTPLHFAAQTSKDAVEILINCGADVNAVTKAGMTPQHFASRHPITLADVQESSIAHVLMKAGAN